MKMEYGIRFCFIIKIKKVLIMTIKNFNGLTQQMFDKPFKNMLYTIYNFAEEERYTYNLKRLGYDNDIESLEFAVLDVVSGVNLGSFKHYIENEVQNDNVVVGVLLFKGKKGLVPIVVKPKSVDVTTIFK